MRRALFALSAALFTTSAVADLPSRGRPIYAPAYDWSGFYLGLQGGYGTSTTGGINFKGAFGGTTLGGNLQFGSVVVGIESEGAYTNIGQSVSGFVPFVGIVTVSDRINALGSVSLRAGYAVERLLLYVKGGGAWALNTISASALGLTGSETRFHSGFDAGGGMEVAVGGGFSVKGEYLYTRYFSQNYLTNSFGGGGVPSGDLDLHTGKIGVNYRFGAR